MMICRSYTIKTLITLTSLLFAAQSHAAAPYPQSDLFQGVKWDFSTHKSSANGSDIWATTWSSDGHLYYGSAVHKEDLTLTKLN